VRHRFFTKLLHCVALRGSIARHYGGELFLAHVVPAEDATPPVPPTSHVAVDQALTQASVEKRLAGMLESLCDIRHEVHLDHGGVPQKLSAIADKCDVDLIVIGSHGFQGIRKLLLGSLLAYHWIAMLFIKEEVRGMFQAFRVALFGVWLLAVAFPASAQSNYHVVSLSSAATIAGTVSGRVHYHIYPLLPSSRISSLPEFRPRPGFFLIQPHVALFRRYVGQTRPGAVLQGCRFPQFA
jgi:nucleotide-binding universal stress UspA family protein